MVYLSLTTTVFWANKFRAVTYPDIRSLSVRYRSSHLPSASCRYSKLSPVNYRASYIPSVSYRASQLPSVSYGTRQLPPVSYRRSQVPYVIHYCTGPPFTIRLPLTSKQDFQLSILRILKKNIASISSRGVFSYLKKKSSKLQNREMNVCLESS